MYEYWFDIEYWIDMSDEETEPTDSDEGMPF